MRVLLLAVFLCGSGMAFAQSGGVTVNLLNPQILGHLEGKDWSLAQALGDSGSLSRTSELYERSSRYRSFVEVVSKTIAHDPQSDQLPAVIPKGQGDVPEMVRLLRGFDDRGKRSDKDLKGGYFIRSLSNNSQHPYSVEFDGDEPRHFDARWLQSPHGFFKLIAVVNRLDRRDFDDRFCGEVRFIYRLSYKTETTSSSMPFFLNAVWTYPKGPDCSKFAKLWTFKGERAASELPAELLKNLSFKQLEVNFQSLRFTSGYMHDFGGQAMYMQRIFRPDGKLLKPVGLENTPDVAAILQSPALLKRFVEFLRQEKNLARLDQGTLVIDFAPEFLAKFAVSWSTMGRARTANKPYRQIFANHREMLEGIDYAKLEHIKTPEALIERLDNLTCMGCHQSGGTAGFHVLGIPQEGFSHGFNRQESLFSAHGFAETLRREAYVLALAKGIEPNRFRPHSSFPAADWVGGEVRFHKLPLGHLCLPNDRHFKVAPGCSVEGRSSECRLTVQVAGQETLFGECVLKERGEDLAETAGGACWEGRIREKLEPPPGREKGLTTSLFAFQDKFDLTGAIHPSRGRKKMAYGCVLPQSGAPLGRMSRPCTIAEENFAQPALAENVEAGKVPAEICANQGGNGFDLCAASGDAGACLESRVVRSMLDTCSPQRPCREDYICQKFPDYHRISAVDYGKKKNGKPVNASEPKKIQGSVIARVRAQQVGFCVPTYFLFNMRLDGHPSPVTGKSPGEPKFDRSKPLRGYE